MLLATLLGIKFTQEFRSKYLFGFGICLMFIAGYKLAFLFGIIPLMLIFPYREYFSGRKLLVVIVDTLLISWPVLSLFVYWFITGQISFSHSWKGRVDFFSIFSYAYWREYGNIIWRYTKNDNFTLVYFILFLWGVVSLWGNFYKEKSLFARYLRGFSLTIIPYFMLFSDYLNQHNYYQMPFLGFVCLTIVYGIRQISIWLSIFLKPGRETQVFSFILMIALFFAIPALKVSIRAPFNWIYPGLDVVGEMVKGITAKDERIFIYTNSQGYAPCVYAQRKCGWPANLDDFRRYERKFNMRYVVIGPFSYFRSMKKPLYDYVMGNYHVKIIGFIKDANKLIPTVMVLERGGKTDIDGFVNSHMGDLQLSKVYRMIGQDLPFYIIADGINKKQPPR